MHECSVLKGATWHGTPVPQAFIRGALGNYLVCMAVLMATNANDVASKAFAVWLPISAFVAMGSVPQHNLRCLTQIATVQRHILPHTLLPHKTKSSINRPRFEHCVANMFYIPFGMV